MGEINLQLPDPLHRKLKMHAALQGSTMQKLALSAIQEYLERLDKTEQQVVKRSSHG